MSRPERDPCAAPVIAIDGPAAAGKGTLAHRLAEHLGLAYLDTGRIYRAVALRLIETGENPADVEAAERAARVLEPGDLDDARLRGEAIGRGASKVAAIPVVRSALLAFQRRFAAHPPAGAAGAVLDGRDIATVVCPDATHKFFVTASLEARAARRLKELRDAGKNAAPERVLADMVERDRRDAERAHAPLVPDDDAHVLDTTEMDADAVFAHALAIIEARARRNRPIGPL